VTDAIRLPNGEASLIRSYKVARAEWRWTRRTVSGRDQGPGWTLAFVKGSERREHLAVGRDVTDPFKYQGRWNGTGFVYLERGASSFVKRRISISS
jgi:hypothetical protein